MLIPDKIVGFNAYSEVAANKNRLVGVTDEVTLINAELMSETLNLAGTLGEIDSPAVGQIKSITMDIPFSNITMSGMKLAADDSKPLILRSGQEMIDENTHVKKLQGRVITVKGMTKAIDFGKLKKGGYGEPKITKEVLYYKDVINGETAVEIDKIAGVFKVAGVDMTKGLKAYL